MSDDDSGSDESSGDESAGSVATTFQETQDALYAALVKVTRAANALPVGQDLGFARSINGEIRKKLDHLSAQAVERLGMVLQRAGGTAGKHVLSVDRLVKQPVFITDTVDNLLEKTEHHLDMMAGKQTTRPQNGEGLDAVPESHSKRQRVVTNDPTLPKPQLKFLTPVDNYHTKWRLALKVKPNRLCDWVMSKPRDGPYTYEIENIQYPPVMFGPSVELDPLPLKETPFTYVDTVDLLHKMVKDLGHSLPQKDKSRLSAIAIDLEHHSLRSYQGFVCLMQISASFPQPGAKKAGKIQHDYIIDTLVPEIRQEMHILQDIFTNPAVVKVFHGAESDILWLQENFNLYIVNLFDTYHATNVLELGGHSLAYLLKTFMGLESDKRYQLADWRVRPLSQAMLDYARNDTHYLLAIYDRLRRALLDRGTAMASAEPKYRQEFEDLTKIPQRPPPVANALVNQHARAGPYNSTLHPMHAVLAASNSTANKVWYPELYDFENGTGLHGWARTLTKGSMGRPLGTTGFEIFKHVHRWRDALARKEDESTHYIMSNFSLFTLAERQPTTAPGIFAACQPASALLRDRVDDLVELIVNVQKACLSGVANVAAAVEANTSIAKNQFVQKTAAVLADETSPNESANDSDMETDQVADVRATPPKVRTPSTKQSDTVESKKTPRRSTKTSLEHPENHSIAVVQTNSASESTLLPVTPAKKAKKQKTSDSNNEPRAEVGDVSSSQAQVLPTTSTPKTTPAASPAKKIKSKSKRRKAADMMEDEEIGKPPTKQESPRQDPDPKQDPVQIISNDSSAFSTPKSALFINHAESMGPTMALVRQQIHDQIMSRSGGSTTASPHPLVDYASSPIEAKVKDANTDNGAPDLDRHHQTNAMAPDSERGAPLAPATADTEDQVLLIGQKKHKRKKTAASIDTTVAKKPKTPKGNKDLPKFDFDAQEPVLTIQPKKKSADAKLSRSASDVATSSGSKVNGTPSKKKVAKLSNSGASKSMTFI